MKKYLFTMAFVLISLPASASEAFTSNELCSEFGSNGAAAEAKYRDKRIIVSGAIAEIKMPIRAWSLRLRCAVKKPGLRGVKLKVNKSESEFMNLLYKAYRDYDNGTDSHKVSSEWVKKYQRGKNIKFSCKYKQRNKVGLYLKECRIN